ncbi:hypothetical protein D3C87_1960640 [compost metagenome]
MKQGAVEAGQCSPDKGPERIACRTVCAHTDDNDGCVRMGAGEMKQQPVRNGGIDIGISM